MKDLIQSQTAIVTGIRVPVIEILFRLAEQECAEKTTEDKEHTVHFSGRGSRQGCSRTEPTDNETYAHDESTEDARGEIGWIYPNLIEVEKTKTDGTKRKNHPGDDRGEHYFENGQVGEVEL